ncbi:MAG: beta-ketoacyl-ACP synthase [Bdellovibrionota bacterium]
METPAPRCGARVAALGIVSAVGVGADVHLKALRAEHGATLRRERSPVTHRETFVGAVDDSLLAPVPSRLAALQSRNAQLALCALEQIRDHVRAAVEAWGAHRVGVVIGSSTSGIAEGEAAIACLQRGEKFPESYCYTQQEMAAVSSVIAEALALKGPSYTISTACSSSAKVFNSGRALIELGICDAVIVGGADSLCGMTLEGFAALDLLSPATTNPFSVHRSGINIGEAAALFLLTREAKGVRLLGVGEASDAYHVSAPEPSGAGAARAMKAAFDDASLSPKDIDYINLHGTGTSANDSMEAKAVRAVFDTPPLCSSTKPLTGHTLGASGAVEAAVCFLILQEFQRSGNLPLPVHRFDGWYDPELEPVPLVDWRSVLQRSEDAPIGRSICMSNSFGFGGSNCSLIFGVER